MNTHGLDPMESCEYELLVKLRDTLDLGGQEPTVLPYTIVSFAILRIKRLNDELAKANAALLLAESSLKELVANPETDFGPAYSLAQKRQAEALKAISITLAKAKK